MQTTKLNLKLYDQVDEEQAIEDARNPAYGVLGLFFFAIFFLSVVMVSFEENDANKIERELRLLDERMRNLTSSVGWMQNATALNSNVIIPKLRNTREYVKCVDYNRDGRESFVTNLTQTFQSQLSKIEKILFVGHQTTELTITNDLSKMPDQTVSFDQQQDVTADGSSVTIKYSNIDRAQGKICFLVQGIKK